MPEIEGDYIVLSWIEVYYDNSVQTRSWSISPDLSVATFMADNTGGGAYVPTSRKVAGKALTSDITLVKGDVGLGNVNNTSDANKPVSTAQAAAIALKIDADKFQVVTELPASPVTGVFYFVKE